MANVTGAGLILEIGVLVPAVISAALPSPFTARTFAHDPASVQTLRIGEGVAVTMVIGLGIAESMQHGSWAPLVIALIVGAAWIGYIEWAIRNPIKGGTDMSGSDNASNAAPPTRLV